MYEFFKNRINIRYVYISIDEIGVKIGDNKRWIFPLFCQNLPGLNDALFKEKYAETIVYNDFGVSSSQG